ncbi:response regulator [Ramlibacter henchirensis]|uniref:Response regulator n=1 Tax=Ramlibacter henchirensis TaxID=204072 RepID=A0A4Z0BS16_9BURK|nr:response regulator [Ramlibacter henchirensis]TFZ00789.1 response regulator [Ramlibacter henchirensis]
MSEVRILLVEDEFSSAEVLALLLADAGYHVTVAADGRQALSRLEDAAPDLLVTDFMMPGMNGAELVKALRATPRYADLPVLLISGAPESALRPYKVPYQAFLRKPFALDEFLRAVANLRDAAPGRGRPATQA